MNALYSGNLKRDYARFAAPTMLALLVFAAYNMVDGAFVGHIVGGEALAAVNLSAPFLSLLFSLAVLIGLGASTILARLLGQGQQKRACELFTQSVLCAVIAGLVVGAAARIFLTQTCRLLGAEGAVLIYTKQYVGTLAPFAVFILVEYNLEALVKADGCPRLAALTVTAACSINAVLDWLFVARLGMGVAGAALGTGLAQMTACGIFFAHFLFSKKRSLRFVRFRFDGKALGETAVLGISEASSDLCVGVLTWLYNRIVLRCSGTLGVAGYAAVTYINTLVNYTLSGASQGLQPLASYHRGRGDFAAARTLRRYAVRTATVAGALMLLVLEWMPGTVVSIVIPASQTELHDFAVYALRRYALSFLFMGFNLVTAGYMTANEKPLQALAITLGRGCIVPAAMLILLTAVFGEAGIWWAALTAEALMALVSFVLLRRLSAQQGCPDAALE